jgi:hypothetical protein
MNSFYLLFWVTWACAMRRMEKIKIKKCLEDPDVVDSYIDLLPVYTEYCLKINSKCI